MYFLFYFLRADLSIIEKGIDYGFIEASHIDDTILNCALEKDNHSRLRLSADETFIFSYIDQKLLLDSVSEHHPDFLHFLVPQTGINVWNDNFEVTNEFLYGLDRDIEKPMMGLQFTNKSHILVQSTYENELDCLHKKNNINTNAIDAVLYDRINNFFHSIIIIIYTDKNLRVEIYDGDGNLLYDNSRFLNLMKLEDFKKKNRHGIATKFDKTLTNRLLTLIKMRSFDTIDNEDYYVYDNFLKTHGEKARYTHRIEDYNQDVRYPIANMKHAFKYIKVYIFQLKNQIIMNLIFVLLYELQLNLNKMKEIVTTREIMPRRIKNHHIQIYNSNHTSRRFELLIDEIEYFLWISEEKHERGINHMLILGIVTILLGFYWMICDYFI
ncbi:hypothetical protein COBT_001184, partial [Conglomerata obtusa]